MKIFKVLFGLFLLFATVEVRAGIRFSFNFEVCAWKSTHIVIVSEGEAIDGQLVVLESLKGDLNIGDTLTVPELTVFKNEAFRKSGIDVEVLKANLKNLETKSNLTQSGDQSEEGYINWLKLNSPYITCNRMMLFLIKSESDSKIIWKPVSDNDGAFLSTIWIEPDSTFVFYQRINPGPCALLPMLMSEDKIKEGVFELMELRTSFDQAITISDAGRKADALLPTTRSPILIVKSAAFDELKKCGKDALPVLRTLMKDLSITANSQQIFETIGIVGDEQIGGELTGIISEELEFWKQTAPQLKVTWWNRYSEPETLNLRDRFHRAYYAVIALRNLKFTDCKVVITEFRDFWGSQPSLEKSAELKEMIIECDKTLEILSQ